MLLLGLVCYKDHERIKNARGIFAKLRSMGVQFFSACEYWQPVDLHLSWLMLLQKELRLYVLRVRFSLYLKNYKEALREALYFFFFLRKISKKGFSRFAQQSAIEVSVTDKHIRLWQQCTQSEHEYLIAFEDDVCEREDSLERFQAEFLPMLTRLSQYSYVDLAGGIPDLEIKNSAMIQSINNRFICWSRPLSNTACAYGLSKSLCEIFLSRIISNPRYRFLPIDWLLNQLFLDLRANRMDCIHFIPPIFEHGSVSGSFKSWQAI